ncbi:MAG TPA: sigma-70 family RNA polymerase sigma factor [Noviherbaspirillum sp.]|uniref:sigma-70 family RNA polymerase sigma factor n=1 Tax=Noviherbaspirillum sp. TaxID=1926288 RepID=UPI002B4AAB53|nr:sigma-70 family RNA polymerase sigma factor [Noviherbaspirillum sp.]HJV87369.1 sigma-70 family RNA polymerase sigma factor [Noviherbaspirillum sp.]
MKAANAPEAGDFEPHRRHLRALAYRMLGSRTEAEDVVQDAWLRWHSADRASVDNARAFLSRTVTNLCLDRIKSAQAQREVYVGSWLPEPVVDDEAQFQPGPEAAHELASDLSFAFMLTLERLSPLERAAFLLHDVFDMGFGEVAAALGRSEAACRQLASRARANVRANRPAVKVAPEVEQRLASAFVRALLEGDVDALAQALAEDARFVSDGGGRVTAVPKPLHGRDQIAKVLIGFARLYDPALYRMRRARINGLPGFVLFTAQSEPVQTIALEIGVNNVISAIYVMRNPDKLRRVNPS